MTNPALQITNLNFKYPHQENFALKNINLTIKRGEFVFLTGKSGCGKSTLARCLNGTLPQILGGEIDGKIQVLDKNTRENSVSDLAQNLGFIFQNPESQFFTVKVEDEVAFGPENLGWESNKISKNVDEALNAVDMLENRDMNVFNLSEGQKQRIAVAANLSLQPEILVMDEPTSNLDPPGAYKLFEILKRLKNQKKTIILIDHRTHHALPLADRVLIMDKGKIIKDDEPEILYDAHTRESYGIRNPRVLDENYQAPEYQIVKQNPVLDISRLSYSYDNGFSIQDINLQIYPGEVVGLVGSNGSGKTTLAKVLSGILKPQKGTLNWEREDSTFKVGMVFQNPDHQLFMDSVYNELNFGLEEVPGAQLNIGPVLKSMNLKKLQKRHPHSLSGGEKQRTLISAFLVREPHLLIMDEPTTGMDYYHMQRLVYEIKRLKKRNMGIMIISHDLEFLQQTTQRVIILSQGKIIQEGPTGDILSQDKLDTCFEGYQSLSIK